MATLQEKLGHSPPGYKAESSPPRATKRGPRIRGSRSVAELLADIAGAEQEFAVVLLLDSKHRVLRRVLSGVGTLAEVGVHPREVFREAVRQPAAAIIFAHNHPSGDPEPSAEDLVLTARLRDAGVLLGIPLLDHVIVAADGFVSLADRGML